MSATLTALAAQLETPAADATPKDWTAELTARAIARRAELFPDATPEDTRTAIGLELAWYGPGTEVGLEECDCDGIAPLSFRQHVGHFPRCAAELDAYSNTVEEHAAYQAANPYTPEAATPPAAVTPTPAVTPVPEVPKDEAAAAKRLSRAARDIAETLLTGERTALRYAYKAGRLCDECILAQRPRKRDYVVAQLAEQVSAAANMEYDQGKISGLVQLYNAVTLLAGGSEEAESWCRNAVLRVVRELSPLVRRNKDGETWSVIPRIADEATALAMTVADGKAKHQFVVAEVKRLVVLSLQRESAATLALAATIADPAAKADMEKQATALAEAAARKAAPKKKSAATGGTSTTPASVAADKAAAQDGTGIMAEVERTLDTMAFGTEEYPSEVGCAPAETRANVAADMVSRGTAAGRILAERLLECWDSGQVMGFLTAFVGKGMADLIADDMTARLERIQAEAAKAAA